jgi:N-methylhydantoinase A/oxoprolinase/acetone carboxylase beta subunit
VIESRPAAGVIAAAALAGRIGLGNAISIDMGGTTARASVIDAERQAYFGPAHGLLATPVIARAQLGKRAKPGPLLIDEYDATTLVPPGCRARLDAHGNIVIATSA